MNLIKLIPFSVRERIRKIVFGKNHFHDVVEYLAAIAPGARVFDVGAQRGYESILFAKAGCEVFAFEPNALFCQYAAKNAHQEDVAYDTMRLLEKLAALPYWRQNFIHVGCVRVIHTKIGNALDEADDRNTITLQSFCFANSKYPDFLKIDTDGDDLKVLEGYPFHLHRPLILSVEYNEDRLVERKLLSEGYKLIYAIYKPQTRARRAIFSRYSLSPEFYGDEWGDVIALLPGYYEEFRNKVFSGQTRK